MVKVIKQTRSKFGDEDDAYDVALFDMPNSNRFDILSISIFSKNVLVDIDIDTDIF